MVDLFPGINVSEAVTALGDSTLLLPLSAALALLLWVRRSPAAALAWAAPLGLGLGGLAALKVVGHACGMEVLGTLVVSPSGHAAFGAAFYGTVGMMLGSRLRGWRRHALLLSVALVVVAVGITRVRLSQHTVPEVLIGLAIGTAAALAAIWTQARVAVPQASRPALAMTRPALAVALLAVPLLALVWSGHKMHVEDRIRDFALRLRADAVVCTADRGAVGVQLANRAAPGALDIPPRLH